MLSYGIENKKADFKAYDIKQARDGIRFKLKVKKRQMPLVFRLPLFGIHNVYNALAAITLCSQFTDIDLIRKSLSDFKPPHMRMEIFRKNGFTIINDSYNSNPLSFRSAVSVLREFPASGRKIIISADMLELGRGAHRLHYQSGQFLAEKGIDMLITCGEFSRNTAKGALDHGMGKDRVCSFKDKDDITAFLTSNLKKGDVILVKGSRSMKMEEICNCFINCSTR